MADKRTQNNMTKAKRRSIVSNTRRNSKRRRGDNSVLEHAKTVLRQRGHEVFEAALVDSRFAGMIYVDTRKRSPVEVIEMAKDIEEREARRNAELKAEVAGNSKKRA